MTLAECTRRSRQLSTPGNPFVVYRHKGSSAWQYCRLSAWFDQEDTVVQAYVAGQAIKDPQTFDRESF